MAADKSTLLGAWSLNGKENDVESISEGLANEFGSAAKINIAKGCDFVGGNQSGFAEAIATAQKLDVVLVCLGEKKQWSGENASRSSIALPAIQEKLVQELLKYKKPMVLILSNGRLLELVRLEPLDDAVREIWQPGVCGGSALAGILSGRINPSGKLSMTFPLTTWQIPTYYNMRQSARPFGGQGDYQDISTQPLYWLGHCLSYTTFTYGDLKLSGTKIKKTEKLTVEVEVSNTGDVKGVESVLWYINDPVCSISRPTKELKFFEKKELAAGTRTTFKFEIDPVRDLSYVDSDGKRFLESGNYSVIVNKQKVKFSVVE